MAEYIDREATLMKLMLDGCSAKNVQSVMDIPAADVAPVVHERWIKDTYDQFFKYDKHGAPVYRKHITYTCSNDYCKIKMLVKFPYCPGCGAKMDKEDDIS